MSKYKALTVILILIFVISGLSLWASANYLVVREFAYSADDKAGNVRMVVLSDLHDCEFGENNKKLITKVNEQSPDVILLVGDFLNEDSDSSVVACNLIQALSDIAPVYFSLGNHEEAYMQSHPKLIDELENAGAVVLEKEYADLDINGTKLRLGGMYDYAFGLNGNNDAAAAPEEMKNFLEDFQNTDSLKVMMAHRPDSFIFGDAAEYWDVDLVVSGHNHGGQIVVPFLGGLFGGDQGWFPEYVHGMYEKDGMQLFITSGLGSYGQKLPRFNNLPEIAVVTVGKE